MTLTASQMATLRLVNERPGKLSIHTIGADYATALQAAGFITLKRDKCHPTAAAAPYQGRPAHEVRESEREVRGTLIGRLAALA